MPMWAWRAMAMMMPTGEISWLVYQSSLAILPAYLRYINRSLTCCKILRHGASGFGFHPKECVLRILSPLKICCLGWVLTHDLWVQWQALWPLHHWGDMVQKLAYEVHESRRLFTLWVLSLIEDYKTFLDRHTVSHMNSQMQLSCVRGGGWISWQSYWTSVWFTTSLLPSSLWHFG
jgi:hypothetical protein